MKKLKLKFFLLSFISLLLILSCSVISSSDDETYFPITQETLGSSFITKTSVVNGKLDFSGAIPNEISLILAQTQNQDARSACPDYDVYSKFVVASTEGQSDIVGVINADNTFSLVLPYGAWTIKAGVKKDDAIVCSSEQTIAVISDSITLPNFNLTSMQSAKGSVDLEMIIASSIGNFTATCISPTPSAWDGTLICSLASGKLTIKTNSLKSGCYIVEFCFYKTSTTNGDLVYSTTQAINVFDNLCTNKWVASAYESNISSDGTFSITAENISNFHLTTLYVDGGTTNAIESGTWLNPCKTVARAVQKCTDSTKTYTISVSGTTEEADSTINLDKNFNFVGNGTIGRSVQSSNYLMKVPSGITVNITGVNINCSVNSNKTPGIKVFGTLNVTDSTIEKCQNSSEQGSAINSIGTVKLTNSTIKSCTSTENGGAIYSSGNLTLVNSIIQDNSSDKNGGGIYFDGENKILSIDATSIIGSSNVTDNASPTRNSNSAGSSGGGIYVEKGILSCTGKVNYNYASSKGGGIYLDQRATATISNNANFFCNTANNAGGFGGSIYNDGTLTIKDNAQINAGQANSGKNIYTNKTFSISGNVKIGNSDTDNNVFLNSNAKINFSEINNSTLTATTKIKIDCNEYVKHKTILTINNTETPSTNEINKLKIIYKKFPVANTSYVLRKDGKLWESNPTVQNIAELNKEIDVLESGDESNIKLSSNIDYDLNSSSSDYDEFPFTIKKDVKITLEADSQKIIRFSNARYLAGIINVLGELTLSNIKLESPVDFGARGVINIGRSPAKFIMENGTSISGLKGSTRSSASTVIIKGGTFIMNGGTISNNTTHIDPPGVYIESGSFIMNGGTISNNKSDYSNAKGGGVYAASGATFIKVGGTISGNNVGSGKSYYCESGAYFGTSESTATRLTTALSQD